jgi:hypothetical protein
VNFGNGREERNFAPQQRLRISTPFVWFAKRRTAQISVEPPTSTKWLFSDGGRIETVVTKASNGKVLHKTTTAATGNGLSTTVQVDSNGDGAVDSETVKALTLNGDGSITSTTSDHSGTTLIDKTQAVTSANGLVVKTYYNLDGDSTVDRKETFSKSLNANEGHRDCTR